LQSFSQFDNKKDEIEKESKKIYEFVNESHCKFETFVNNTEFEPSF